MNVDGSRPHVCVLEDGRIGLFVGGSYRYVSAEIAKAFALAILAAIEEARGT